VVADWLGGGEPGGLSGRHPRAAATATPAAAADRLTRLSGEARGLLEHIAAAGGLATGEARRHLHPDDARTPAEELLAHGLLTPRGDGLVVPGEVGIALRGGHTTAGRIDQPPELAVTERDPNLTHRTAAGRAAEFVRRTEVLLEWWSLHPPASLRSGGLGVRDLRAATTHLRVSVAEAALVIEVAAAAHLIATRADADGNQVWVPTDDFDRWRRDPIAQRWTRLARAWLQSPRAAALVGQPDQDGRTLNALVSDLDVYGLVESKRMALETLTTLPPGHGLASGTGLASLVARLQWVRPRRPPSRTEQIAWTVTEAGHLGILGMEVMSEHGRALVAGEDPAPVLEALLPPMVSEVLIQADLTAIAPGPLTPRIAASMDLVADVESGGSATVYRFTAASLRRAFTAGWSAEEVHTFLAETSATPVPQPLSYLVDDTVRSFGRLRVGHADAFIRSDDESALAELLHHPKADSLGLRRIAPTVVVATTPVDVLLPRLRELGLAPVVEAPDGTVRVSNVQALRARTPKDRGAGPAGVSLSRRVSHDKRHVQSLTSVPGQCAKSFRTCKMGLALTRHRGHANAMSQSFLRDVLQRSGTESIQTVTEQFLLKNFHRHLVQQLGTEFRQYGAQEMTQ
jgi:hypothetical protein